MNDDDSSQKTNQSQFLPNLSSSGKHRPGRKGVGGSRSTGHGQTFRPRAFNLVELVDNSLSQHRRNSEPWRGRERNYGQTCSSGFRNIARMTSQQASHITRKRVGNSRCVWLQQVGPKRLRKPQSLLFNEMVSYSTHIDFIQQYCSAVASHIRLIFGIYNERKMIGI